MNEVLRKCAESFGRAPRRFSLVDRLTYFRAPKPVWLLANPRDALSTHFQRLPDLFVHGVVTWGHVIQANELMFRDGSVDCPGEVVYSLEDPDRVDPRYLQQVAQALFQLKGTQPTDPELRPIAHYLTDEMIRVFGLPVPSSISPLKTCRISTTYFLRKHLPNRRLSGSLLPIVVHREDPHTVTTVPERYWPKELVDWWTRE